MERTSISEVIRDINNAANGEMVTYFGGSDTRSAEAIAAEYAVEAADEAGYGVDKKNIEAHLELLKEDGANFDSSEALKIALFGKIETEGNAEPTSRMLEGSGDAWAAEEWIEYGQLEGQEYSIYYLFSEKDITWDDGSAREAEDYPWDVDHVSKVEAMG